jgi:hypothetical protein
MVAGWTRRSIQSLLGDDVVRLVVLTRLITVAGAPVTLFLVAATRPPAEQGFYFVFANLQAVTTLFEYGVATMLVQFAAHSSSSSPHSLPTQSAAVILRRARRWFVLAAVIVTTAAIPAGLFMFSPAGTDASVPFIVPWLVLGGSVGLYLTIIPFLCVLEGIGEIRRVQRMRIAQATINTLLLWTLIPTVGSLTAIALASVANLLCAVVWLASVRKTVPPMPVLDGPSNGGIDHSLYSRQTHTAITWIVGFLGPQLLAPIIFRYQGPVAAGQVGLSLAAASAPLMFSLSWLQAHYPRFGKFVAQNELARLDAAAAHATSQALLVCALTATIVLVVVGLLGQYVPELAARFLPPLGVAALCLTSLVYLLYQAMAAHLRAHREEALLWPITIGTAAVIVATRVWSTQSAFAGVVAYTAAVVGVLLPLSVTTFLRRRRALHTPPLVD